MRSIYKEVYNSLKQENTKISKKAFDVLDREAIRDIVLHDDVFWFEHYTVMEKDCPDYIYDYLIRFIKRKFRLRYLYEL